MTTDFRARAALSAPEQGPTDEEIMELMPEQLREDLATASRLAAHGAGPDGGPGLFRVTLNAGIVDHCRAALARWGRPAVEPVPFAERLPGPEDCDAEGRCWWLDRWQRHKGEVATVWLLRRPDDWVPMPRPITWAPHWALPLPQEAKQ
jgi:hypothetical protein